MEDFISCLFNMFYIGCQKTPEMNIPKRQPPSHQKFKLVQTDIDRYNSYVLDKNHDG